MKRIAQSQAIFLALVFLSLAGVARASFEKVTESLGIDYVHAVREEVPTNKELGLQRETLTPASNHSGGAAVDVDGDGWTDFLGARFGLPPALYMNQGDGTFVEEGSARGLDVAVDAASFGAGDFDNDGDLDLFMAPHRGERFFLFINDGTGQFTEEAVERGAALEQASAPHEGYSIGLVDYDRDGYLDLYASEWGPAAPGEWDLHSVLLRNRGAAAPGHFENVTEAAGLTQRPAESSGRQHGFSSAWADFDGDGWPDLALVADFGMSRLYWNNGDGTFTDGTSESGVGLDEFGMGVAVTDYDDDGLLDFYVTSIFDQPLFDATGTNNGNKLYRNLGGRRFEEVASELGVDRTGWGWGAAFLDFNNNGRQDLIVTNGMDAALGDTLSFQDALDDPTTFFLNPGTGSFSRQTNSVGISDTGFGKAVVVWDYDEDGDEDLLVTQSFGPPVAYRSDASGNGNEWLRLTFEGKASNRDGIGAVVRATAAGKTQTALYNPSNGYLGQREGRLHFGLGAAGGVVDRLEILWPSGIEQVLTQVPTNQTLQVVEPEADLAPPVLLVQPVGGTFPVNEEFVLEASLVPGSKAALSWEKDGEPIPGATSAALSFDRLEPADQGVYRLRARNAAGETLSAEVEVGVLIDPEGRSVARLWNEFLLAAIRRDFPDPTIHARNLYHLSAALWDAFWAYEPDAWDRVSPLFSQQHLQPEDWGAEREAAQREAMSYAAYRVLRQRYAQSVSVERIRFNIDWLMGQLGYDPAVDTVAGNAPAAVGNRIAAELLAANLDDGSNEANGFADLTGYQPVNEPMAFKLPGAEMNDPNRWQPLAFDFRVAQNGIVLKENVQEFVGVNWRGVAPFAIPKDGPTSITWDPGPPPLFGSETHQGYVDGAVEAIRFSALLDPASGSTIDISPRAISNNTLGTNDGAGRSVNPNTGEPYAPNWANQADYARVLAEFWADGPASETPPGHWNTLLNEVADHPLFERRYLGQGEPLPELEWDVRAYLALNGAMHDAAIGAWTLKRQYDSARPISMIRYLGGLGQSSDPSLPSYHAQGLPLIEGLIEAVSAQSAVEGGRHEGLAVGEIAIRSWLGEPAEGPTGVGGVGWLSAERWMPYQLRTFVSPAFPGYVSGHSAFSRAAAETLALLTGSPFFPGGLGEAVFEKDAFLQFERGPSETLTLQWATYYDAADEAGISRLYGGIHVPADDFRGRVLGARVGVEAFLKAHALGYKATAGAGLEGARVDFPEMEGGETILLALAFGDGKGRAVRSAASEEAVPLASEDGIYFFETASDDGGGGGAGGVAVESDDLRAIQVRGAVAEGETLSARFVARGETPRLISVRARAGSRAPLGESGPVPVALSLYKVQDDGEQLIARSGTPEAADWESIALALSLRSGLSLPEARAARALFQTLSPGAYRVELQAQARLDACILEIEQAR